MKKEVGGQGFEFIKKQGVYNDFNNRHNTTGSYMDKKYSYNVFYYGSYK